MTQQLCNMPVGSIVKMNVDGTATEFLVVQQGKPSSLYDNSCNGTWVLMKDIYERRAWNSSGTNDYANSTIHSYLNSTFLNLFDADIKNEIKQVKIPYVNGTGDSAVASGSNGLSAKIFPLSSYEVGWTTSDGSYFPVDGAKLDYFTASSSGNSKRIAYLNGTAISWWHRSPYTKNSSSALFTNYDGETYGTDCSSSDGIRPALILPSTFLVSDDGTVSINTAPTVSTDGAALGEKNAAFAWKYTVADADGDTINVNEYLDGSLVSTHSGLDSGMTMTFGYTSNPDNFRKILNGSHTLTVIPSDDYNSGSPLTATFTKAVYTASVTLAEPLSVAGDIEVAVLSVSGSIPEDANYKVEVTNNAKDSSPVWQDCTKEVKRDRNIVFENKANTNGAAFNFRITVSRGASGVGGYIDAVRGAFQ